MNRVLISFFLLSSLLIAGLSCQAKQDDATAKGLDMPVAMMDGETITLRQLIDHPGMQDIVDQIILEKLVLKKAADMKLDITDDMVYQVMDPYVAKEGGRRKFLDGQHAKGMTLNQTIYFGKIGLLQEKIVDSMLIEPTYDEVVAFLQTDIGKLAYKMKAQELGKNIEDVTVEDVYDMALQRVRDTKRRDLYDKLEKEILPTGHQVVNLLKAAIKEDSNGDVWVAAEPAPPEEPFELSPGLVPEQLPGEGTTDTIPSEGAVE